MSARDWRQERRRGDHAIGAEHRAVCSRGPWRARCHTEWDFSQVRDTLMSLGSRTHSEMTSCQVFNASRALGHPKI